MTKRLSAARIAPRKRNATAQSIAEKKVRTLLVWAVVVRRTGLTSSNRSASATTLLARDVGGLLADPFDASVCNGRFSANHAPENNNKPPWMILQVAKGKEKA